MQSLMFLLWTKPLSSLEINVGRIWASMSTKTLEIILNLKLSMAIGLQWLYVSIFLVLKMSTTFVRIHVRKNSIVVEEFNENFANIQTNNALVLLEEKTSKTIKSWRAIFIEIEQCSQSKHIVDVVIDEVRNNFTTFQFFFKSYLKQQGVFVSSLEVIFLEILFSSLLLLGIIFISKCFAKTKISRNVYNIYLI